MAHDVAHGKLARDVLQMQNHMQRSSNLAVVSKWKGILERKTCKATIECESFHRLMRQQVLLQLLAATKLQTCNENQSIQNMHAWGYRHRTMCRFGKLKGRNRTTNSADQLHIGCQPLRLAYKWFPVVGNLPVRAATPLAEVEWSANHLFQRCLLPDHRLRTAKLDFHGNNENPKMAKVPDLAVLC